MGRLGRGATRFLIASGGLAFIVWIVAMPVHAQDTRMARGRELYARGLARFDAGEMDEALGAFRAAYEVSHVPAALYNVATTLRAMHRYVDALDTALTLLREHPEEETLRPSVIELIREMRSLVAVIVLNDLPPQPLTLSVDGDARALPSERPAELAVDPGARTIVLEDAEAGTFSFTATLARGERRELSVVLTPPTPIATPGPQLFWSWIALTTAAAALGVTIGLGVHTQSTYDGLHGSCGASSGGCSDAQVGGLADLATATNTMIALTSVLGIVTVVAFIVEATADHETQVVLTPFGAAITGAF